MLSLHDSRFLMYTENVNDQLDQYRANEHWAKIELRKPRSSHHVKALQERVENRFPMKLFRQAAKDLDPQAILGNNLFNTLMRLRSDG